MNLLSKLLGRPAKDAVTRIEVSELVALMKTELPPMVIDVRGPDEFAGPLGHIEEARNVPLDQLANRASELLDERRPVVFVCHTDRRSSAAAEHLRRAGAKDIAVLSGGMVAWRTRR